MQPVVLGDIVQNKSGSRAGQPHVRFLASVAFLLQSQLLFASNESIDRVATDQSADLTTDDLVAMVRATRDRLRRLEAAYSVVTGTEPENPLIEAESHHILKFDCESGWYNRQRRYRFGEGYMAESDRRPTDGFFENWSAWDGAVLTEYRALSQSGTIQEAMPVNGIERDEKLLTYMLMRRPAANGIGLDDGSLESLLRRSTLRSATEQWEGEECRVIDASAVSPHEPNSEPLHFATAWIDMNKGGLPVRTIFLDPKTKAPTSEVRLRNVKEIDGRNGGSLWFPERIEFEGFVRKAKVKETIDIDLSRLIINPEFRKSDFRLQFPDGTRVGDMVADRVFVVGAPPPGDPPAATERRGPGAVILLNLLAVCSLILFWWFRQRRQRPPVTG
jgi:hypothetical protein